MRSQIKATGIVCRAKSIKSSYTQDTGDSEMWKYVNIFGSKKKTPPAPLGRPQTIGFRSRGGSIKNCISIGADIGFDTIDTERLANKETKNGLLVDAEKEHE